MAWDGTKGFMAGFLAGASAGWATRDLLPILTPVAKPFVKQGLKAAILGYERSREIMAVCVETLSDVMAEVQQELRTERASAETPTGNTTTGHAESETTAQTHPNASESVR